VHIISKVENIISTVPSQAATLVLRRTFGDQFSSESGMAELIVGRAFWIIEIFKGIDQENQKVQELLLHFKCELVPKLTFFA
jgi:hypothetical protein